MKGREMESGTQTHCPRDEWNSEIRSAFSKMRSKYRVSDCTLPSSSFFLSISRFRIAFPCTFQRRRNHIFSLFTRIMRNILEITISFRFFERFATAASHVKNDRYSVISIVTNCVCYF